MEEDKKEFYIKQLTQDVRDLKKYIEDFLIFLPLPVCSVTPLGIIVDANQAFYRLTNYRKEENIGGETIFRAEILFKDKKKWLALEKTIQDKGIIRGEEINIITKDKKEIPVSLSASYKEDEQGNLTGYFLALTDISELKALQENLEEKVKERTKELRERVGELERFHKLTVGRELKMIELKKKIKKLEKN